LIYAALVNGSESKYTLPMNSNLIPRVELVNMLRSLNFAEGSEIRKAWLASVLTAV
jgi:hypothetical protein